MTNLPLPTALNMQQLLVSSSNTTCDVLGSPPFAMYAAKLRRLSVSTAERYRLAMAARTLEHVRFSPDPLTHHTVPPLLPLPVYLRSIDLQLQFAYRHQPWLIDSLSALLTSAPATLGEISVTFSAVTPTERRFQPDFFLPGRFAALDRILMNYAMSPRIQGRG
ncbi:hypothetical protein C8R44DRAFT_888277 [Mycena epipterygia]|nr:hypothetical protein C8R44DRAFT_888277 [Mycena epipterygia]